jgi:hypothetical protein
VRPVRGVTIGERATGDRLDLHGGEVIGADATILHGMRLVVRRGPVFDLDQRLVREPREKRVLSNTCRYHARHGADVVEQPVDDRNTQLWGSVGGFGQSDLRCEYSLRPITGPSRRQVTQSLDHDRAGHQQRHAERDFHRHQRALDSVGASGTGHSWRRCGQHRRRLAPDGARRRHRGRSNGCEHGDRAAKHLHTPVDRYGTQRLGDGRMNRQQGWHGGVSQQQTRH